MKSSLISPSECLLPCNLCLQVPAALNSTLDLAGGSVNIHVLMTLAAFASVFMGNLLEGALLLAMFTVSHIGMPCWACYTKGLFTSCTFGAGRCACHGGTLPTFCTTVTQCCACRSVCLATVHLALLLHCTLHPVLFSLYSSPIVHLLCMCILCAFPTKQPRSTSLSKHWGTCNSCRTGTRTPPSF